MQTDSSLATIEMGKDQFSLFPLNVVFKSLALNTSYKEERSTPGFTLHWFLKDSNGTKTTKKLPARKEDWKRELPFPGYKDPMLQDIVELAKELRLQNMSKEEILTKVIYKKVQNKATPAHHAECSMGQVKPGRHRNVVFSKVFDDINTNKTGGHIMDKDIETGYGLFHAIVFCPPAMVFKLFTFIDQLLSDETSRTIVQTIVNLFQTGAITDKTSYTLAKQFYNVLASTLDLQFGKILLAASTKAQLHTMKRDNWPFFADYTDLVEKCLTESDCGGLMEIYQDLGKSCSQQPCPAFPLYFLSEFLSFFLLQKIAKSRKRCPKIQST